MNFSSFSSFSSFWKNSSFSNISSFSSTSSFSNISSFSNVSSFSNISSYTIFHAFQSSNFPNFKKLQFLEIIEFYQHFVISDLTHLAPPETLQKDPSNETSVEGSTELPDIAAEPEGVQVREDHDDHEDHKDPHTDASTQGSSSATKLALPFTFSMILFFATTL